MNLLNRPLIAIAAATLGLLAAAPALAAPATKPVIKSGADDVIVSDKSDKIIQGALRFLASKQLPSGAWAAGNNDHQAAITGYVVLAFLTSGQLPNEGEHGKTVQRAMNFLLECVGPDGYVRAKSGQHNMYGHGIATIALAELYGQTKDPAMKPKLERAIKLIINTQNNEGGWRYSPEPRDADISVTVLQLVALRAASNSGIEVPATTIERGIKYVRACYIPREGGFAYQANGAMGAGYARSAAAMYSLMVCGVYEDPMVQKASDFLFKKIDDKRYWTYGSFYAAPAQYMMGGDTWRKWYAEMEKRLVSKARPAADNQFYWDRADGDQMVNDVYITAVYTMILAMPYSYVPLYQR